jgi:segregation and condensation protein B
MENEMETPVKEDNLDSAKLESCENIAMENVAASANSEEQDVGSPAPQDAASDGQPQEAPILSEAEQVALLEALLLASGDPLSIARIQDVMGLTKGEILARADKLQASLAGAEHGIELIVVAEKLQLRTKAAFAEHVRQLMAVKPRKLSQAALETLAVIAYQQPVVKSEIDKIRGVDVAPTLKTLLERKLVKIIGYQASVGQPSLYGTTEDFLQVFGLASLSSLPALQDLKAMVKEPGEAGGAEDEEQSEAAVSEVDDEVAEQTPPESPENSGAQIVQ